MIPRQKFIVGELVAVYGAKHNNYDTDKTEVIDAEYFEKDYFSSGSHAGWRYKTDHQPDKSAWWWEASLVKLHNQGDSFSAMMNKLNLMRVTNE
jgi:hypothetical protein